jgi:hypothetical protein
MSGIAAIRKTVILFSCLFVFCLLKDKKRQKGQKGQKGQKRQIGQKGGRHHVLMFSHVLSIAVEAEIVPVMAGLRHQSGNVKVSSKFDHCT